MTTPLDRARELRDAVGENPDAVSPDHVVELLRYPKRPVQRAAAEAFLPLVTEHPAAGTVAVGRLAYLLRSVDVDYAEDPAAEVAFAETLLLALARVAAAAPEKALTAREEVLAYLDDPDGPLAAPASVCVAQFVEAGPASFVSYVDEFTALLDSESPDVRRNAAHIMTQLGATHPRAIADAVPMLADRLTDSDPDTAKKAAVALGLAARGHVDAVAETITALVAALDADDRGLRANAAGALAEIAGEFPEAVGRHDRVLLDHLEDDNAMVRRNTVAALARLADSGVAGAVHQALIELLDDPDSTVRATACQALGSLDSPIVQQLLRQTAEDDDSQAVRQAAKRALESA